MNIEIFLFVFILVLVSILIFTVALRIVLRNPYVTKIDYEYY